MGLTDKLSNFGSSVENGVKETSVSLFFSSLKLISAFVISITLGLIFQIFIGYGNLALTFFTLTMMGVFLKIFSSWSMTKLLVFDLICILIAQILKMYIMLAP